jgi:hypothetical protein
MQNGKITEGAHRSFLGGRFDAFLCLFPQPTANGKKNSQKIGRSIRCVSCFHAGSN